MKKIVVLAALNSSLLFAGQTGGGGGLGKQKQSDLMSLITEHLPSVNVEPDILRRAEARLSVKGVEAVDMPLDNAFVTVKRLNSTVVDTDISTRFVAE